MEDFVWPSWNVIFILLFCCLPVILGVNISYLIYSDIYGFGIFGHLFQITNFYYCVRGLLYCMGQIRITFLRHSLNASINFIFLYDE